MFLQTNVLYKRTLTYTYLLMVQDPSAICRQSIKPLSVLHSGSIVAAYLRFIIIFSIKFNFLVHALQYFQEKNEKKKKIANKKLE